MLKLARTMKLAALMVLIAVTGGDSRSPISEIIYPLAKPRAANKAPRTSRRSAISF